MSRTLSLVFASALLASTPAAAQAPDFSQAQVVEVTLSNFKFTPQDVHLTAGQPVILRLTNSGGGGHNFDAPAFFTSASIRPTDTAAIRNGEVELRGHQSVDIGLVPVAGNYPLRCTHPLHAAFGMTGTITVE